MKGLIALLMIALIGFSGINYLQVQSLKEDVARLQAKVEKPAATSEISDKLVAEAMKELASARDAMSKMDVPTAQRLLETSRTKLAEAAGKAGDAARPTLKWLEQQAEDLRKQVRQKLK